MECSMIAVDNAAACADGTQADITDLLFRGVRIKRFWVGEWLSSKSDVHRIAAVETVMQYLADGTISVKEGDSMRMGPTR